MYGVTQLARIRNERIRGTTKVGEICKKYRVYKERSEVVWACDVKKWAPLGKESDANEMNTLEGQE